MTNITNRKINFSCIKILSSRIFILSPFYQKKRSKRKSKKSYLYFSTVHVKTRKTRRICVRVPKHAPKTFSRVFPAKRPRFSTPAELHTLKTNMQMHTDPDSSDNVWKRALFRIRSRSPHGSETMRASGPGRLSTGAANMVGPWTCSAAKSAGHCDCGEVGWRTGKAHGIHLIAKHLPPSYRERRRRYCTLRSQHGQVTQKRFIHDARYPR